jgi:hypothetical protein
MSHALGFPAAVRRVLFPASLPLLLALGSAAPVWSQTAAPEPGANRPSSGKRGGHWGPITPAILRDSIGVTGSNLEQYTQRYNTHMAATKPARDSLKAAREALRSGARDGNRSAIRERRGTLRERFQDLARRDQQFEAGIKELLSPDQQKRYSEWKESRRSMAGKRWHRHHPDRGGEESGQRGS